MTTDLRENTRALRALERAIREQGQLLITKRAAAQRLGIAESTIHSRETHEWLRPALVEIPGKEYPMVSVRALEMLIEERGDA